MVPRKVHELPGNAAMLDRFGAPLRSILHLEIEFSAEKRVLISVARSHGRKT